MMASYNSTLGPTLGVPTRSRWKAQLPLLVSEILLGSPLLIPLLKIFERPTFSAPQSPWVDSLIGLNSLFDVCGRDGN
jgi:hypothetical protein